jgi:methionyl-tRNA synthetase
MTNKTRKILIGVAWPYVNGDLHPGHIAGCYLPADIFARYQRLIGNEVVMVSGSDCFGTPITMQADKEGTTPKEIVEKYSPRVTKLLTETYKISFDSFTKTDTDLHRSIVQKFFINLAKNGFIIKKRSQQYYSEEDQKFLPDRYVEGECPYCSAKEQRGDQCESCGRSLNVGELINPYAKLSKKPVTLKETEHYFVDLSKFKDELREYIDSKKVVWRTWVWKEASAWIDELQPRAITRDIDWGVEIPQEGIPEELKLENAENKRFYVWFDAVIGYFSEGIKIALGGDDGDPPSGYPPTKIPEITSFLEKFWRGDDKNLEHYLFVGKDNLFFHTLWWQALLLGQKGDWFDATTQGDAPLHLKLADNVPVNQFLNLEGQKFSKSRGIYIDSTELVEKYGLDAVRFYLASIMPENADANWKWEDFQGSVNSELNGNIGNFIHRTLSFYKNKLEEEFKHFDRDEGLDEDDKWDLNVNKDGALAGSVKLKIRYVFHEVAGTPAVENNECLEFSEISGLTNANIIVERKNGLIYDAKFHSAIEKILELSTFGNKYFNDKQPWKALTENRADCEKTIYNCLQIVNALRILLSPFCPDASDNLSDTLGLEQLNSKQNNLCENKFIFDINQINSDLKIKGELKPLFNKVELDIADES